MLRAVAGAASRARRPDRRRPDAPASGGHSVIAGEVAMPRYIIERTATLTREELDAAGRRSYAVLQGMPEVRWIRSYVSAAEGKIYCEYDAPSPEAIREHARRAGLPVDKISEVALEISPAMFA